MEGKPENGKLFKLKLDANDEELSPADELKGLGNYDTVAKLTEKYGEKVGYISFHEPNKGAEDIEQWEQELKNKKDGNFAGYHFPSEGVSFTSIIFEQKVDFSYATFHGEAIFVEAVFSKPASFLKTCFQ